MRRGFCLQWRRPLLDLEALSVPGKWTASSPWTESSSHFGLRNIPIPLPLEVPTSPQVMRLFFPPFLLLLPTSKLFFSFPWRLQPGPSVLLGPTLFPPFQQQEGRAGLPPTLPTHAFPDGKDFFPFFFFLGGNFFLPRSPTGRPLSFRDSTLCHPSESELIESLFS